MRVIGLLLVILGMGAAFVFWNKDTSVEVPTTEIMGQQVGGGRVNNLGLMQDRQNGLIFGIGAAILGAILTAAAPKPTSEQKSFTLQPARKAAPSEDAVRSDALNVKGRLDQLQALKDSGAITDQEHEKRRLEILSEI